MSVVAPAVYRADPRPVAPVVLQSEEPLLEHPRRGVAVSSARVGAALLIGDAPRPPPVTADREPRRDDARSRPGRRRAGGGPLLWVRGDMTTAIAGGADPGAVRPPYERDGGEASEASARAGRGEPYDRTSAFSKVTDVLLGPAGVTGLSTLERDVLGGPDPGERLHARRVHMRPRFARGGMQWDVSWAF